MSQDFSSHTITLSQADLQQMHLAVAAEVPEEACGLLAGLIQKETFQVREVFPITNELHSPVQYRMDPQEQIDAFNQIESQGLELVGIYHSHPGGPADPSPTDIAEAYYPEAVYLIWSHQAGKWQCNAFLIHDQRVDPVDISVMEL
jgi:proteasome lid subunit RPN8/RPN11